LEYPLEVTHLQRICLLIVFLAPRASLAEVTEDFNSAVAVSNGTTLGVCNQLTASLYLGGSVSVPGNGSATISTVAEVDVAMLQSTQPLPNTYKVTVTVGSVSYPQYTLENGVTWLAIVDTSPVPATESWWASHRMVSVEVTVSPGSPDQYPVYINYFDSSEYYTWNGTLWGSGDPNWIPLFNFDPAKDYEISIQKSSGQYTITVTTGTTQVAKATVPVGSVRPATAEYFVVGDRVSNYFKGSMKVKSITQPKPSGCVLPDTGIPVDASIVDSVGPFDVAPPVDLKPPVDMTPADSPVADGPTTAKDLATGDSPITDIGPARKDAGASDLPKPSSWDLYTPDLGKVTNPNDGDGSACDCEIGLAGLPARTPWLLLLLALPWLLARRRR